MPQQINLLHPGLTPRPEPLRSAVAAWSVVGAAGIAVAATLGLNHLAGERTVQALDAEQRLAALQARVAAVGNAPPPSRHAVELQRLRAMDAGQRQVRSALDTGSAGRSTGYAEYLMALSRQAQPALWITGFAVAGDGIGMELRGRMTDPHRLPEYLRHLNSEPLFKGRDFAQMELKSVEPAASSASVGAPVTEFTLRALPVAATELRP